MAGCLVDIELVAIEGPGVGVGRADLIGIQLGILGPFETVSQIDHRALSHCERVAVLAEEVERHRQRLGQEQRAALESGVGLVQVDLDGLGVDGGVTNPEGILETAVLGAGHALSHIAEVHLVFLAQIVAAYHEGPVVGLLVVEHTVAAVTLVGEGEVQLRSDVLGGQQVQVVLFAGGNGEGVAPVSEHRIWALGVVHRHRLGRIGIVHIRREERRYVKVVTVKIVGLHGGRTGCTKVDGVRIVLVDRQVKEVIVVRCIYLLHLYLVGTLVVGPAQNPLVIERIGHHEGLQDARLILSHAVAIGLLAFAAPLAEFPLARQVVHYGIAVLCHQGVVHGQGHGIDAPEDVRHGVQSLAQAPCGDGIHHRQAVGVKHHRTQRVELVNYRVGDNRARRHLSPCEMGTAACSGQDGRQQHSDYQQCFLHSQYGIISYKDINFC